MLYNPGPESKTARCMLSSESKLCNVTNTFVMNSKVI